MRTGLFWTSSIAIGMAVVIEEAEGIGEGLLFSEVLAQGSREALHLRPGVSRFLPMVCYKLKCPLSGPFTRGRKFLNDLWCSYIPSPFNLTKASFSCIANTF